MDNSTLANSQPTEAEIEAAATKAAEDVATLKAAEDAATKAADKAALDATKKATAKAKKAAKALNSPTANSTPLAKVAVVKLQGGLGRIDR